MQARGTNRPSAEIRWPISGGRTGKRRGKARERVGQRVEGMARENGTTKKASGGSRIVSEIPSSGKWRLLDVVFILVLLFLLIQLLL